MSVTAEHTALTVPAKVTGQILYTRSGTVYVITGLAIVRKAGYGITVGLLESGHPRMIPGQHVRALVLAESGAVSRWLSTRIVTAIDIAAGGLTSEQRRLVDLAAAVGEL